MVSIRMSYFRRKRDSVRKYCGPSKHVSMQWVNLVLTAFWFLLKLHANFLLQSYLLIGDVFVRFQLLHIDLKVVD